MGFVFTIIYVVLTIISPEQFGPNWATYHALAYLAAVTALFSLPNIFARSSLKSAIQTYLLLAFIVAIGLSQIANHWMGGALKAWLTFLPSAAIYFFIVANVTTARRLKVVALACVVSVFVLVGEGLYGYYGGGFLNDVFVMKFNYYSNDQLVEQIPRLRGVGFLHDPNDFAQMLLIALPLSFIAWRQGRAILNSLYVLVPTVVLLWATYLTHSRGALIGLAVLGLVAARRKLGTTASLALGVFLVMAMLTIDFTGGRALSAGEGGDRLEAWATGLELFKSAPVLGVGFGNFTDFNEITAHNSFVLALAELGLLGSTIWVALLVVTTMNLNRSIAQRESSAIGGEQGTETQTETSISSDLSFDADQQPFSETPSVDRGDDAWPADIELVGGLRPEERPLTETLECEGYDASKEALSSSVEFLPATETAKVTPAAEIEYESIHELVLPNHWMVIIRLALISFMTTSWFLSRTYASTTYLVLGLAAAAVALDQSSAEEQGRDRWIFTTLAVEVLAIVFVYLVGRLRH